MNLRSILVLSSACVAPLAAGVGCKMMRNSGPTPVPSASAEDRAALLDQVKGLEGEWVMTDETGKEVVASVMKVTSGGSAVREVLFPGAPHEMTNVYHMDGQDLLVTHYCAASNQPRMRARRGKPGVLEFRLDALTDWQGGDEHYMGELVLSILDKDHIAQDWKTFNAGTNHPGAVHFDLRRRK